jgi:hypothetical protein
LAAIHFKSSIIEGNPPSFGGCLLTSYTETKANQNEAVLWQIEVLGMKKPPVGAYAGILYSSMPEMSKRGFIFHIWCSHTR